jgi:hypothetical protein
MQGARNQHDFDLAAFSPMSDLLEGENITKFILAIQNRVSKAGANETADTSILSSMDKNQEICLSNIKADSNLCHAKTVINSQTPTSWCGMLDKQSCGMVRQWQPRQFELRRTAPNCAVLTYYSKNKGYRHLRIEDARREPQHDSGLRTAFSISFAATNSPTDSTGVTRSRRRGVQWMRLMAETDLKAVAFLSCLRCILEPNRAWPTLHAAIHFPADALRQLA